MVTPNWLLVVKPIVDFMFEAEEDFGSLTIGFN
jgi:hypothetical protein